MSGADRRPTGPRPAGLLDWFDAAAATGRPERESILVTAPMPRAKTGPGPRRLVVAGLAAAVVTVGALAVIGGGQQGSPATAAVATPRPSKPAVPSAAPITASPEDPAVCGPSTEKGLVRGNGPGGLDSGPGVILAFEYRYYHDRNAAKARELVTDDAQIPSAEHIQGAGIDTIPKGTSYCVSIRIESPDSFLATLTEVRPDKTRPVYTQRITTISRDGRMFISGVTAV